MRKLFNIFFIKRGERLFALVALLTVAALNGMMIAKYWSLFSQVKRFYWPHFIRNFHISGFDPITLSVVSDWSAGYNVYRHPLLAFYMYVPYQLNRGLTALTGCNCALPIVAVMVAFCAFYSALFLRRTLHEVVGLRPADATLLTAWGFSFAYVMLAGMVPDHFVFSMLLLTLSLYIAGKRMPRHRTFRVWQSALYFLLTAGTTLTGGLKIFMAALFTNGRRFFRPWYLILGVILPAALLWGISRWEYRVLVWPQETARHAANAKRKADKAKQQHTQDSLRIARGDTLFLAQRKEAEAKKRQRPPKQGRPISNGEFMRWTDVSTSRTQSAIENLFGEGIQLHEDHLLEDEFRQRPMIVRYRHWWNYAVEALVVLLFAMGIWAGRRQRFMWLALSYFALDMALHLGLGFGLNEVYIMTAHWAFAVPICLAYAVATAGRRRRLVLRATVALLTVYLWTHNVWLIAKYLYS